MIDNEKDLTVEFIKKAKMKYGDRFDYSKTEYINRAKNVIIICYIHGEFKQRPRRHLRYVECEGCIREEKEKQALKEHLTNNEFIDESRKIHGYTFNYSKTRYSSHDEDVIIGCLLHGFFNITPRSHLNERGCNICEDLKRKNDLENLKKLALGSLYEKK
jgi:hypothetical protein